MLKITVGMATCGVSAGAAKVYETFRGLVEGDGGQGDARLHRVPRDVLPRAAGRGRRREEQVHYGDVDEKKAKQIFQGHVLGGTPVEEFLVLRNFTEGPEQGYLARQVKIVLRNCGYIDPESIEEYEAARRLPGPPQGPRRDDARGGHRRGHSRVRPARPRRRRLPHRHEVAVRARRRRATTKYVICNADEGDPGAFMDRSVLEGDPHAVLEGMIIAGYAIGASHGYIYCRAEYPLAIERLKHRHRSRREENGLPGRRTSSAPASASTSSSRRAPAPSSAARRRRSSPPSRASAGCRGRGRRSPP